jgi:membrane protein DedA with SNARE-associated domain
MEIGLTWWDYAVVAALSGLKFVPGVLAALALKMSFWETTLTTGLGGMAGATVFSYFGDRISQIVRRIKRRYFLRSSPPPSPKPETLAQRIWKRYGLAGVAILTPPIFSPPIGTAIALGFGTPPAKIVAHMCVSFAMWAPLAGTLSLFDYRSALRSVFGA